jgi:hypothetical protein
MSLCVLEGSSWLELVEVEVDADTKVDPDPEYLGDDGAGGGEGALTGSNSDAAGLNGRETLGTAPGGNPKRLCWRCRNGVITGLCSLGPGGS